MVKQSGNERGISLARLRFLLSLLRLKPFDTSTSEGRSAERYRRIALTTCTGFASKILSSLLSLISVPILLGYLGKERFAVWAIISSIVAWASLFELGLANGLVNLLSAAHGRNDQSLAQRSLSSAHIALWAMASLLGVTILLGIAFVPWNKFLGIGTAVDSSTVNYSIAAALGIFTISLPYSITSQVLAAYQRSYIWNAFTFFGAILGFFILIAAVQMRVEMPSLVLAFGITSPLTAFIAYLYTTHSLLPWIRPRRVLFSKSDFKELMRRSVPIFLFQVGALIINQTQSILLAHQCNLSTVTAYSVGMRVYLLFVSIIQISTNSFVPALRESYEHGDSTWTNRAFARLLSIRLVIAGAGGLAMIFAGNLFLRVWLHRNDIFLSNTTWLFMALLMFIAMWTTTYAELLSIMDRLWPNVAAIAFSGLTTLTLTYILSSKYQELGAIISLVIPSFLVGIALRIAGRRFVRPLTGRTPPNTDR